MFRSVLIGLLAGLIMIILMFLLNFVFYAIDPSLKILYENSEVFRAQDDPLMILFPLYPFVLGIILAWIWTKTRDIIKVKQDCQKGFYFGFVYWLLTIPGILINYSSFPIPFLMPLSWSIISGIQGIAAGIVFAKLLKK